MEHELDNIKKIIGAYKPADPGGRFRTARALRLAVVGCHRYIKNNAQTDRGCAQRIARQLGELLDVFWGGGGDKTAIHRLHTRKLAEEHIELMLTRFDTIIQEEEKERAALIQQWVRKHLVFSELKRIAAQVWTKGTYVLLFCQQNDQAPVLVTRSSKDGHVYTRFRQQEFTSDFKIYQNFQAHPPIVGAAVIAPGKLLFAVGNVPRREEDVDELKDLLKLSRQTVEVPAGEFLLANPVLKQLHDLASSREIPKDAYVLLFQFVQQTQDLSTLEVVVKIINGGKVISRFRAIDFIDKQKLFEAFRERTLVAGAAIIRQSEILQLFGETPQTTEGQSQLEILLDMAKLAYEKPFNDFIADNEILKSICDLANSDVINREADVVLFVEAEGSGVAVMHFPLDSSKTQTRIPLREFRSARVVYEKLANVRRILGASVIAQENVFSRTPSLVGKQKDSLAKARSRESEKRPVVIAAYGRTPLKVNLVATKEILQRLGVAIC